MLSAPVPRNLRVRASVQPAALVGGVPVGRAIAPPAVEQALRDVGPGHVHPTPGLLRLGQMVDLDLLSALGR